MADEYVPEADTSWGLIYRLNYLWAKADGEALNGNYGKWEIVLDTIFRNLLYRNRMEESKDGKSLKLSDKDILEWRQVKKKIKDARTKRITAIKQGDMVNFSQAQQDIYFSIMMYDVWLRKFMHHELKLYMKESKENPSTSLFGGFGNKKRR